MKKIYIAIICGLMPLSLPASAAIYKCTNSAGKVEFRDKPCASGTQQKNIKVKSPNTSFSHSGSSQMTTNDEELIKKGIEYMDHLKACSPYTRVFELAIFGTVKQEIIGKSNGRCHVVSTHFDYGTQEVCHYTDKTIALMTSKKKYSEVRSGQFTGSSDSLVSARMTAECIAE